MSAPAKPCGGACILDEGHLGRHVIPGYVDPEPDPPLPPCTKCGLVAAHSERVCEEVQALRAHVLLLEQSPSKATRELVAEAIGLLAMWTLRAVSGLAGGGLISEQQRAKVMWLLSSASEALHSLGEFLEKETPNAAFERLESRALGKASILAGGGVPNLSKRGRG